MTSGEYLFTLITGALYSSAWWSLVILPDDKVGEAFSAVRWVFLGLSTILIFWYVAEKLITEARSQK